jgi:hypothetical protein
VTKNARQLSTLKPRRAAAADGSPFASAAAPSQKAWKNKYRAQPVVTDEGRFASKKEYADWCALKLREKAGLISHLERQVKFPLSVNAQLVTTFIADAVFFENGKRVVVDSKGVQTPVYRLKKKLMRALLNIEVQEI